MIAPALERVSFRRRGRARIIRTGPSPDSTPTAEIPYRTLADEIEALRGGGQ